MHLDDDIPLTTNTSGTLSFSKMINSSDKLTAEVYFEGDDQYLPSSSSLSIYSIPKDLISGLDNNLYVGSVDTGQILRFDGTREIFWMYLLKETEKD